MIMHDEGAGRLRLSQTAYSSTIDDVGGSGGIFGVSFPKPDNIREISFAVTVNRAEIVGCSSNDSLGVTDAEFRGSFFNTESNPMSQVGDVDAVIGVERNVADSGKSLTIAGFCTRCEDQFCATQSVIDYKVLGSVSLGRETRLRLKWDQPNHRFIFQLNDAPEVASPYSAPDTTPPVSPSKGIGTARVVPHCTGKIRPHATIDASFRDVYANP